MSCNYELCNQNNTNQISAMLWPLNRQQRTDDERMRELSILSFQLHEKKKLTERRRSSMNGLPFQLEPSWVITLFVAIKQFHLENFTFVSCSWRAETECWVCKKINCEKETENTEISMLLLDWMIFTFTVPSRKLLRMLVTGKVPHL